METPVPQGSPEPTSEELAQRAREGDRSALDSLFARHKHEAYRIALRLSGDPFDAEEILQLALERAFRYLRRYDPTRGFRPWLLRIVVNRARTYLRMRGLRRFYSLESAAEPSCPSDASLRLVRADLRAELCGALAELGLREREGFVLKHVEGLSYQEIAEITGDSVGTLKVRNHRTRTKLLESLKMRGVTAPPVGEYKESRGTNRDAT